MYCNCFYFTAVISKEVWILAGGAKRRGLRVHAAVCRRSAEEDASLRRPAGDRHTRRKHQKGSSNNSVKHQKNQENNKSVKAIFPVKVVKTEILM